MRTAAGPGDRLAERLGADLLLPAEAASRFAVQGVPPAAVASPRATDELAALLAEATAEGWIVAVAGEGSMPGWGRPPARLDLVVTTARMDRVLEHLPADLIASVEAGVPLASLDARLAAERQWLPLDPPVSGKATIGRVFAMGEAGPLQAGYGGPRDLALGLQLVTGDGRVLEVGGRVVKNVAGYDLVRLAVGSRGTLGIIARLHLRLFPTPAADVTRAATGPLAALLGLTAVADGLGAAAVELRTGAPAGGEESGWTLFVRFTGSAEAVADAVAVLEKQGDALGVRSLSDHEFAPAAGRGGTVEAGASLRIRLSDLPMRLEQTLEVARELVAAARSVDAASTRSVNELADFALAADAAAGTVRVWTDAPPPAGALVDAVRRARAELGAGGGSVSVVASPPDVAEAVELYGEPGGLELMRKLKRVFDPAGVLAPGRWVV